MSKVNAPEGSLYGDAGAATAVASIPSTPKPIKAWDPDDTDESGGMDVSDCYTAGDAAEEYAERVFTEVGPFEEMMVHVRMSDGGLVVVMVDVDVTTTFSAHVEKTDGGGR